LGHKYDVVNVSSGYAANFLLPQKLAEAATDVKVAQLEKRREAARAAEDARMADLKEKLEELKDVTLIITGKADSQGHLFKKVRAEDIVSVLKDEHNLPVARESVLLDAPLHEVGNHEVTIDAAGGKIVITVQVAAE